MRINEYRFRPSQAGWLPATGPVAEKDVGSGTDVHHNELPGKRVSRFSFRAIQPTYDTTVFSLCGKPGEESGQLSLWSKNAEGILTMEATATAS